jgi:hypothetical protein
LISGQRSQNLCLPKREENLGIILGICHHKVLNLDG